MFLNQAGALLRKNLTYQRRHRWETTQVFLFPIIFFLIVGQAKRKITNMGDKKNTSMKAEMPDDPSYPPPLFIVPDNQFRAVRSDVFPFSDLPTPSCRPENSCPAIVLITESDQNFIQQIAGKFFREPPDNIYGRNLGIEKSIRYSIQSQCPKNDSSPSKEEGEDIMEYVQGLSLWRKDKAEINDELFKGFLQSNNDQKINEIMAAFDFGDSSSKNFKVNIWYNATIKSPEDPDSIISYTDDANSPGSKKIRSSILAQSQTLVTRAYLQSLLGDVVDIMLEFLGDMPQFRSGGPSFNIFDYIFTAITPLMFWILFMQLFPIKLETVVYDKQQRLRIMMKMHGLGDTAYWSISYLYALLISTIYIAVIIGFCIKIDLYIVTRNSLVVVIRFFFLFVNLQIALAFVFAAFFSEVRSVAVVVNTLIVLAIALNGRLVAPMVNQEATPAIWIFVLDLNPWFSFFHGLLELTQFGVAARRQGTHGISLHNLTHSNSGVRQVCIIMLFQWLFFLILAAYLDKVVPSGNGVKKHPLFFLKSARNKLISRKVTNILESVESKTYNFQVDKDDVARETERVEDLINDPQNVNCSAICHNLKKVYPEEDGNPPKVAVKGLSLAFNTGECFGMLGPSGSGKTSFINVMTGHTDPTSGTAYVAGLDLLTEMDEIYNSMGICHNTSKSYLSLLWDILTGREHLLFYGRLKNLNGKALDNAVDDALKSVKLFDGGVPDKLSGTYSGGMKRRLSVAISLIGCPKIVYLDEPSTGLDPASRNTLWSVIKEAKKNTGIVLTTHSMEEAEHLCDRIGIFVDGTLECLGSPEQLKGRYGDTYVFSITTDPSHDSAVCDFVKQFSPNAERVYHISGTQKFELPETEIELSAVFRAVKQAKQMFDIQAWGVSDTSLEDVFIKVATAAQAGIA